ncbi:MAG: sensor histidine kinase [Phycisphaerales bacterium]
MKRAYRTWWSVFASCAVLVVIALICVTVLVLNLERNSRKAEAENDRQDRLRLALWRMDAWAAARIGPEAGRPHDEYQPFLASSNAYTRMLYPLEPGEVLTPSPLLTYESPYFVLHFQIDEESHLTSPQAPQGNLLDLAEATLLPEGRVAAKRELLELVQQVGSNRLHVLCEKAENANAARLRAIDETLKQLPPPQKGGALAAADREDRTQQRNWAELQNRAVQTAVAQNVQQLDLDVASDTLITEGAVLAMSDRLSGALVPVWIPELRTLDRDLSLVFLRRVEHSQQGPLLQGIVADWDAIKAALAEQARDLVPDIAIEPRTVGADTEPDSVWALTTLPAQVTSSLLLPPQAQLLTPARLTLLLMWLAMAVALFAVAMTLRSIIDYADRRARFASALTHELRTPLTTFQMYSEMLADGMVQEPQQQKVYHQTMRDESIRLSSIVEDVLTFARVEDGRSPAQPRALTMAQLADRLQTIARSRCQRSSAALHVAPLSDQHAQTQLRVEVETIERIVLNLIDNACKSGCNDGQQPPAVIDMAISLDGHDQKCLLITICDDGPGINERVARRVFQPFERGDVEPGSPIPGVGLGLPLARELAQGMGGSLTLHPRDRAEQRSRGACFHLRVPSIR